MDEWIGCLERGGQINAIYTGVEKASDKVPHRLLLQKLKYWCTGSTAALAHGHFHTDFRRQGGSGRCGGVDQRRQIEHPTPNDASASRRTASVWRRHPRRCAERCRLRRGSPYCRFHGSCARGRRRPTSRKGHQCYCQPAVSETVICTGGKSPATRCDIVLM